MKRTYLLIAALLSSPTPYCPEKFFWRRLYNFLCLKFWGHQTESHQISTRYTEMIADYSAEIKIAIYPTNTTTKSVK